MTHAITLESPQGDKLRFVRMTANEQLGRPYRFALQAISRDAALDLRALLGTAMAVRVASPQGYTRHYHGIVAEAAQTGFEFIDDLRYAVYALTLVPKPWLLKQRQDCRVFKNRSVPEIVRTLLAEIGYTDVKLSLSASYAPREYCVQYRESGFAFISRLMEQEGIYYFFEHTAATHTMVLADALGAHVAVPAFEQIPYCPPGQKGSRMKNAITDWALARSVHSKRVRLTDYDYLRPRASLQVAEEPAEPAGGADLGELDVFDYPGEHADVAQGRRYAQVRVEALNVAQAVYHGSSDACGLAVGALFKLKEFPQAEYNQEYLMTEAVTDLVEVNYVSGDEDSREPFACRFSAVRSRQPFRTLPTTPRPMIAGLQTAVVHGPAPEDIAVDQYGRVQVNFFWNAPDKSNADSSCPVRVASGWAGRRWGSVQIPRVGQEVVVSFLDGNPDRPLIIAGVYNADHMPPYSLPENKTQSGVRSHSHPGGGSEDYNEIRFEDRKGSEELLLHAQRDLRHEAEHDHFVTVEHDEVGEVGNDRRQRVGRDDALNVGKSLRIEAGTEIELVTGAARLLMKRSGEIVLSGTKLTLDGRISVGIQGGVSVDVNALASLSMRANASVLIQSNAVATARANAALLLQSVGPAVLKGLPPIIG